MGESFRPGSGVWNLIGQDAFMQHHEDEQGSAQGRWAALFLVLVVPTAMLGFGYLAGDAAAAAQIAFFLFLVCFVVAAVIRLLRGPL